ncbi:MAG: LamG domain-containing protein [Planctomycetota bacterium]
MKRAILLFILLLALPGWAANDFISDPNCKAVWRFENGALTTDSKGTNTLTASVSPPTADTDNYHEGAASADFVRTSSQFFNCPDADLDAGFPLKGGTANKTLTICCWIKPDEYSASYNYAIWGKAANGISMETIGEIAVGASPKIGMTVAVDGGTVVSLTLGTITLVMDQWYHVAWWINGSARTYGIRLWDETAEQAADTSSTGLDPLCDANPFTIGREPVDSFAWRHFDGQIDELVVFNRVLTSAEIMQIREGKFGSSNVNNWWWRRRN